MQHPHTACLVGIRLSMLAQTAKVWILDHCVLWELIQRWIRKVIPRNDWLLAATLPSNPLILASVVVFTQTAEGFGLC